MVDFAYENRFRPMSAGCRTGFSLVEAITVLVIAAMVMIAALTVYGRVKSAAASVSQKLEDRTLPREILQRIAEDLDRLAAPGLDTAVTINNKFQSGYNISQMIIENKIYDKDDKPRIYEKIVWQSSYDPFEDALILYRSHSGLNLEDKVIADAEQLEMQELETELFIPLCSGITYFTIQVPKDEKFLKKWTDEKKLPKSVEVTISFAEPFQADGGELDVYEEDKITRTIAIDRTRKIKYVFVKRDLAEEYKVETDPNEITTDGNEYDEDLQENRNDESEESEK